MSLLDDYRAKHRRDKALRNGDFPPTVEEPASSDEPHQDETPEDLQAAIAAVECIDPIEVNEDCCDPHRLARLYTAGHQAEGVCTLVRWRDEFHRWDGSAYRVLSKEQVGGELVARIKWEFDDLNIAAVEKWMTRDRKGPRPTVLPVTRNLVSNVTQALVSETLLAPGVRQPSWLGDSPPPCS